MAVKDLSLTVHVDADQLAEVGFLRIRRLTLHNQRADGTRSASYPCDVVVRPAGQDAVVVVAYEKRKDGTVWVLLRDGLRPGLFLVRDLAQAPLPETRSSPLLTELPAGIVEAGEVGQAGLLARAAAELHEETGFVASPSNMYLLGAGMFPSPGAMVEKFYFVAVQLDPSTQAHAPGDGSPMEEGARTHWMELNAAIHACMQGTIEDAKTELGLRRLRDSL